MVTTHGLMLVACIAKGTRAEGGSGQWYLILHIGVAALLVSIARPQVMSHLNKTSDVPAICTQTITCCGLMTT